MGVISKRLVWLVAVESMCVVSRWMWVESMGVASECGCREVSLLLLYLFFLHPYCLFFLMFYVLVRVLFVIKYYAV